jgi:hypothetical protein
VPRCLISPLSHPCATSAERLEKRLPQVVTLDGLGKDLTDFEVTSYPKKPAEHLAFEHVFDPEGSKLATMF